ncbi:uncharacterized protein A1O9_11778 [Exophiala aquamarina CBS 119918]|uniref:Uncharacterized protein n=1 Tax=Exophiala aquamarina CBS 119918 TaxID=1182545 RepID=A0A072NXJ5_9EURO|nr:uncharacterized protein A1O9_11778 [Exophiala aquamarina CBS 119918]KEF52152.1 hypothetical protein A1O9_11778 [Exophiala aquamarina CBS 119918]
MEDAPPADNSLDFDRYSDDYSSKNAANSTVQITGSYGIYTPLLGTGGMVHRIDKAADTLWGKSEINLRSGILLWITPLASLNRRRSRLAGVLKMRILVS